MNLSRPKQNTWWIAVVLGVLGLLGHWGVVAAASPYAFLLVAAGFVILVLATYFKDL